MSEVPGGPDIGDRKNEAKETDDPGRTAVPASDVGTDGVELEGRCDEKTELNDGTHPAHREGMSCGFYHGRTDTFTVPQREREPDNNRQCPFRSRED